MIFLKSNLISYKKNIKKLHIFYRVNPYFNVSRFFYSELVNTVQCLAIIKSKKSKLYGCRCPNKVKVGNYCGRHLKGIKKIASINIDTKNLNIAKRLDQYYTRPFVIDLCMELYTNIMKINKNFDLIIEPSAGAGAFVEHINSLCNHTIFMDIDPKMALITNQNFLSFNRELSRFSKVHIIGNPPFKLISVFIRKASEIAHVIGFILPLSFKKISMKQKFPLNFHCVLNYVLPKNNFLFNNKVVTVPTVFQVWEKRCYNRSKHNRVSSRFFSFVKKNENPHLAFRRVGSKSGEISTFFKEKSESSHYFIKLSNELSIEKFILIYKNLFFEHNNTVGPKSISQQELVTEFNKYLV